MTLQPGLFRRVAASQTVVVVAAVVFATICAQGQESPASLVSGCPAADHQAATPGGEANDSIAAVSPVILKVRGSSFPELRHIDVRIRPFRSQSDYFRTRFSLPRFLLLMPMRYFVDVNPALFQSKAPSDGVCAIIAHELAHVLSLSHGNRIRRLGLIRLMSERYTVSPCAFLMRYMYGTPSKAAKSGRTALCQMPSAPFASARAGRAGSMPSPSSAM